MTEQIDRRACKERVRNLLESAEVSPRKTVALWLVLRAALSFIGGLGSGANLFNAFLVVLTLMLSLTLDAGFVLYCMTLRRGERAEYLTLFDGFAVAGKVILLAAVKTLFIALWSMLFVIPGLVAYYRYRFALFNLLENPDMGVMEAMRMSKRQTDGYKWQIFGLDMSYLAWGLAAVLPDMVYRQAIQIQLYSVVGTSAYWNIQDVSRYLDPNVLGVPRLAWQALILVWAILVSVFYLAHYPCAELEYFDIARGASGADADALPPDEDSHAGFGDGTV